MVTEQVEEYEKYHARQEEILANTGRTNSSRPNSLHIDMEEAYFKSPTGPLFIDLDGIEGLVRADAELIQLAHIGSIDARGTSVFIVAPRDMEKWYTFTFKYETQAEGFVHSLKAVLKKHNMVVEL